MNENTEKITFFTTPEFKEILTNEAIAKNISVSELVRQEFEEVGNASNDPGNEVEIVKALLSEVEASTQEAKKSITKANRSIEKSLKEIRGKNK